MTFLNKVFFELVIVVFMTIAPVIFATHVIYDNHTFESDQLAAQLAPQIEV